MRALTFAAAIALAGVPNGAYAQSAREVLSNPQFAEKLGELLETFNSEFAGEGESNRIDAELERLRGPIRDDLSWSGHGGYLLHIRAFQDRHGVIQKYVGPSICGSAQSPVDALTICMSAPTLGQGETDRLFFSPEKSYFVWATLKKPFLGIGRAKVEFGEIPHPYSTVLWRETATALASEQVVAAVRQTRNRQAIDHAVQRATERMENAAERALLARTHTQLVAQRARLTAINAQLAEQLNRAARANEMLRQMDALQGIMSLAPTINSIREMAGPEIDTRSLANLDSIPAVRSWLSDHANAMSAESQRIERDLAAARAQQRASEEAVLRSLTPYYGSDILY